MKIPKASPEEVFSFLGAVEALENSTIDQIRGKLKSRWPPVADAKIFCEYFQLIVIKGNKISLSETAERMLKFTGQMRIDFVRSSGIILKEPFRHLLEELSKKEGEFKETEISDIIKAKFPKEFQKEDIPKIKEAYSEWLVYIGFLSRTKSGLAYVGGEIKIDNIYSLKQFEYLEERRLKHTLIEGELKSIIEDCRGILDQIKEETDDNLRGKKFQEFTGVAFRALGFIPRTINTQLEKDFMIFSDNKGGGDVVLLNHFPSSGKHTLFEGLAIACEAKSTEGNVGSGAIGQARNLVKKVKEKYKNYVVQPLVISRSKSGLDPSGSSLAPPEVIHLRDNSILEILRIQKNRLNSGAYLIIPSEIFEFIQAMIKKQNLQPSIEDIKSFFER